MQEKAVGIITTSYMETSYEPIKNLKTGDFFLHTEITWDSTSGLAGCGLMYFSGSNYERSDQYRLLMLRLANAPAWDIEYFKNGEYKQTVTSKVVFTRDIDDDPGSTNQVDLIVRGTEHTVYINSIQQKTYTHTALTSGQFAFIGFQESGTTTCLFNNSWVWEYK